MRSNRLPRPDRRRNEVLVSAGRFLGLALTVSLGALASPLSESDGFLDWFWQRPLDSQGGAYDITGVTGHPLSPGTCGQCHKAQFDDWENSRHARAMSVGVLGQLPGRTPEQIQECLNCHAPLQEQAVSLRRDLSGATDPILTGVSREADESLHRRGVVCAACHVRSYRWFGPPRSGNLSAADPEPVLPHDGSVPKRAFEDSKFCAACHQFPAGGYVLNGKLIENTYEEWKASPQANRGLTCQSCHMPDRRHLFRGIHDPETVRSGVSISVGAVSISDDFLRGSLSLSNSGTGHFFPTYVTPRIILEIYQETSEGRMIDGTGQHFTIARDVSLDLTMEYADTRVPPGGSATLEYARRRSPAAVSLVAEVRVEPDAFYRRFFEALLETELTDDTRMRLADALRESSESAFTLLEKRYDIAGKTEPIEK